LFSLIKRICDNIYIGFGQKYSSTSYTPPAFPQLADEYPKLSLIEGDDPKIEDEEKWISDDEENDFSEHKESLVDEENVDGNQ
jgi:hypothetical protein